MAQNPFSFTKQKPQAPRPDFSMDIKDVTSRIRVLEERFNTFTKKISLIEQNMLSSNKKESGQLKDVNTDLIEIKRSLSEVKERMRELIADLGDVARIADVTQIQKYVDMWNPLQFVSKNEVRKLINDILNERKK